MEYVSVPAVLLERMSEWRSCAEAAEIKPKSCSVFFGVVSGFV